MNVLRGLMLLGSLGKVWSKSQTMRNTFSSISIIAYFKLMNDYENGTNDVVIRPTIEAPPPPTQFSPVEKKPFSRHDHRKNVRETMKNVNRIIYDR